MTTRKLYVSHGSALHFWRTNPPQYVLEGKDRDIRALRGCPETDEQVKQFCLSEAEFGQTPIDVLIPAHGPRPRSILNYHTQKAALPPHSLYPLRDGIHLVSPDLCFVQLCATLPFFAALELGMELCGTYALRPYEEYGDGYSPRDYQLTQAASLIRRANAWKGLHGLVHARKVARYLEDGAASPMETKTYLLLCLPLQYGGHNFERPAINTDIDLDLDGQEILKQKTVRPDFLWEDHNLVVEYDGGYHNDPAQRVKDEKRRAVLESMGYTVVALKKQQVYDPIAFEGFASMLRERLGVRKRALTVKQQFARDELREALLANTCPQ